MPVSGMGRAAISAAAEEMAAVWWQHHPHSCALQVPIIMSCIYTNVQHISAASARDSLDLLLLSMAEQYPTEMIVSLVDISPSCERY